MRRQLDRLSLSSLHVAVYTLQFALCNLHNFTLSTRANVVAISRTVEKHTSTQSSIEDTQQRSSFVFYTCMRIELKVLLCNILHIAHHFAKVFSSLITLEESPSLDRDPSFSWGSHFSRFSAQNTKPQGDRPEKQPFSNAPLLLWAFVFSKTQRFFERSRCVFAIVQ